MNEGRGTMNEGMRLYERGKGAIGMREGDYRNEGRGLGIGKGFIEIREGEWGISGGAIDMREGAI